ncbi:hypothetical protein PCH_Pc16g03180 [Penicillium rubens Wisconsin 54-1255]|uniref:Uncharacterized protein n=1 Tax=Penicillium rubens (strain ATCC 28089 / DSM 1075 / NRRL 1951 / Wisconsin 54-1255) TaxID=500485 RepID=B6H8Y0_PENRW|nr:hypothetical protein PCH_Pc16g03180 [Penicillium rubens Wisconsin 54-1255]
MAIYSAGYLTTSYVRILEDRHVKIETMPVLEQKTGPLYPEILAIMRRYNLNVASAFQCGKMTMATPLANTRNLRMHPPPYPGGDSRPDPFWASQPGHHECCCSVQRGQCAGGDKLGNLRVKNDTVICETTTAFALGDVVAPRSLVLMPRARRFFTHNRDKKPADIRSAKSISGSESGLLHKLPRSKHDMRVQPRQENIVLHFMSNRYGRVPGPQMPYAMFQIWAIPYPYALYGDIDCRGRQSSY